MAMEGNLRSISLSYVERAREDADFIEPFVRRELPRELLERKLGSAKNLPSEVRAHYEELLRGPPPGLELSPRLDLHKAWHGIHYLLTGEPWGGAPPLACAVLGAEGQNVGVDQGYGAPSYLTPTQVKTVAAALAEVGLGELRRRYDPAKMTELEIYPSTLWLREHEDNFDWLMQFYEPLPGYYASAAASDSAMLVWIA
jgi:hypothetical protein